MTDDQTVRSPYSDELESFSTQIQHALQPVSTPSAFRAHLREGLTLAARFNRSRQSLSQSRRHGWGWVIGAAALGSAAGLIAVAWRGRAAHRPLPPPATPGTVK